MFIILALIALFGLLVIGHKHSGPAHLAAIAGVEVYRSFGGWLNDTALGALDASTRDIVANSIYLLLIFGFPMLLYFRSHPKTRGWMHIVESAIFAILLVSLAAPALVNWINYDLLLQLIFASMIIIQQISSLSFLTAPYFLSKENQSLLITIQYH
jgi:hypothetical protein